MIAIAPEYTNASIYLYPSSEAADKGLGQGGSGFIVSIPSTANSTTHHLYAVTNRHVIDGGNYVIRFNTKEGASVIATRPGEWTVAIEDDLAVIQFDPPAEWAPGFIGTDVFLGAEREIEGFPIFPGDEVMFFGRFVTHDGQQRNTPVVRFGNVSMLPDDGALVSVGNMGQLAFLVECRSLGGFSGSPAFVKLVDSRLGGPKKGFIPSHIMRFLGVDCAHLPFWSPITSRKDRNTKLPEMWAETNSGMAVVIPAWRLLALLNDPELLRRRTEEDALLAASDKARPPAPGLD